MIKNVKLTDYGLEGTVRFGLFDKDVNVLMDEKIDMVYANKCVQALNNLKDEIVQKLCEYSIKYYNDFCDESREEEPKFDNLSDVLKMIDPVCLVIEIPNKEDDVVVHLEMNCEWEKERGLEWLVRNDEVLYVGTFETEYPDKSVSYFEELTYNYVFN